MTSRWLALVAVFVAVGFAQSGEPEASRRPVGIVTAIVGEGAGARAEILRAGSALEIGVRSGELLFAGDTVSSRDSTVSFLFCPKKTRQGLEPGGVVEFADDEFAVSRGRLSDQGPARFCRLPDLTGLPAAYTQHYGGALTRSLAPEGDGPTLEQRVAALLAVRRTELKAQLKPIDEVLAANADDVEARIARASVLAEFGLSAAAATELQTLAGRHPGATGTRALIHELFEREAPEREPEGDPQTYALVVGVSKYQKLPAEQQLLFARSDADLFYRYLTSPAGGEVPKENIVLITDEVATKAAIENSLETFLKARARQGDTVVIFIAAHGTVDETGAYILAHDSDPQDLRTTALPMVSIQQLMDTQLSQVGRVIVYVDVCRAGTIGQIRSNEINVVVGNILAAPLEIFGMMASGPKEYSYESDNFGDGHGAFSYFLVRALCGAADEDEDEGNQDGETTVDEVVEFVETQVRRATRRKQNPESIVRIDRDEPLTDNPVCEFELAGFKPLTESEVEITRSIEVPPGPAERFLDEFEQALAQGDILPETPGSAFGPLRQLKRRLGDSPEGREKFLIVENRLRVALEDAGQQVLLRYLAGDEEPQTQGNFLSGALYFRAAREQLAPDSTILLAKQRFCEGRAQIFRDNHATAPTRALDLLEEAVRLDPRGAYGYNAIGIAYLEQAEPDYDRAGRAFSEAARLAPHWAYPRHNLALTYAQVGRFSESVAMYREAIDRAPRFAYLPYNLGLVLQRTNQLREAETAFRQAINAAERLPEATRGRHLAMAHNAYGYLKASTHSRTQAEKSYRQAIALAPSLLEPRHNLAALLCRRRDEARGGACRPSGEQAALDLWNGVVRDDPDYLPSRLSLARTFAARGDSLEAIEQFRKVVELQPDYVGARLELATQLQRRDTDGADEELLHLTHARKLQPDNFDIQERIGDVEQKRGRRQEASRAYRSALQLTSERKSKKRIRGKLDLLDR